MLDYNKYKNQMVLLDTKDFTTYNVYKGGKVLCLNSAANVVTEYFIDSNFGVSFADTFGRVKDKLKHNGFLIEETFDKDAYNKHRQEYRDESNRLEAQFKTDLEEEYGVTDNPKKDLLYSKAYDDGHSGGFNDIESSYADMVDLIL
jgi:hypothetical protein